MLRTLNTIASLCTIFVLICAVSFGQAGSVRAQEFTSGSFKTVNPTINNFGGGSTSTSFSALQSGNQTAQGESLSTSFVLHTGFLYFDSFTPASQNWQWFDDAENETPSTPLAAENVAPASVADQNVIKLRLAIAELADLGATDIKLRLQYSTSSNFSESVNSVVEIGSCGGNSGWCYADGAGIDNDIITTNVLSDSDSCVASVGTGCGTHNESGISTSSFNHVKSAITEYEFTIKQSGAVANTVYFFRAFDVNSGYPIPLNTAETYPSLAANGATLTFSIEGITAGTSTEGVVTDIATTPLSVPFGTLPIGTPVVAAHRLIVSTNAGQGYKIFTYQRQGLINSGAFEISPVTSTNGSPLGWSTSCDGGAAGCYGYHSGEDVLDGGSTRFAANDSFAKFTTTPTEVAYSSGPTSDKRTDLVYKLEVRSAQESGDYSGSIVYIVTPVF